MPNFSDTFNRANAASVGNNWMIKNKTEGNAPTNWTIAALEAVEPASINTILYRDRPVAVGADHTVTWHFRGKNAGEAIFRYTATGGLQNARWSVVIVGAAGSLQKRVGATQTIMASWTRADTQEFTIIADLTATTITIFDTGFAGPNGLSADLTDSTYAEATGVGVGSGKLDDIDILDLGSYSSTVLSAAAIQVSAYVDCKPTFRDPQAPSVEYSQQHYASVLTDPYALVEGLPVDGSMLLSVPVGMTSGSVTTSDTGQQVNATLVDTTATYRWLPQTLSSGSTTWAPYGGGGGPTWMINTQPQGDPKPVTAYSYYSGEGIITRPALAFNGKGFMQLTGGVTGAFTLALVAVLHGGKGPKYSLFKTDRSNYAAGGPGFDLSYSHGKYTLLLGTPVGKYEGKKVSAGASIVVVSFDPSTNRGYFVVQDLRRQSTQFTLNGLASVSPAMFFGADMSDYDQFTETTAGNLDVLEMDYWTYGLSAGQIQRFISKVAPLYGVAV